jgi:hypothetical protein
MLYFIDVILRYPRDSIGVRFFSRSAISYMTAISCAAVGWTTGVGSGRRARLIEESDEANVKKWRDGGGIISSDGSNTGQRGKGRWRSGVNKPQNSTETRNAIEPMKSREIEAELFQRPVTVFAEPRKLTEKTLHALRPDINANYHM